MLLLYIYIAAFVLGAALLLASLFLGHHDIDGGADLHVEAEADAHVELDAHGGPEANMEGGAGPTASLSDFWLPFVSVRFWIFFLSFFGLTGSVFALFGLAGRWATLLLALAVGMVCGLAAALVIQYLRKHEVGQAPTEEDLKGLEGVLLLPLAPGGKGKVRLELRGQTVDLVAVSDETRPIERGRKVVVIDVRDDQAVVISAGALEA